MFTAKSISYSFDGHKVLKNADIVVERGDVVGIFGANGSGKTTFINTLSGFLRPHKGQITVDGIDLTGKAPSAFCKAGITRSFQEVRLALGQTVLDNVLIGFPRQNGESAYGAIVGRAKTLREEKKHKSSARGIIDRLGLKGTENSPAYRLSYGEKRLLSLGCCIATKPRYMLLDEPTASVSIGVAKEIRKMIREISEQGVGLVIVEHNIDVIDQLCSKVIFMASGRSTTAGSVAELREMPEVVDAFLGATQ